MVKNETFQIYMKLFYLQPQVFSQSKHKTSQEPRKVKPKIPTDLFPPFLQTQTNISRLSSILMGIPSHKHGLSFFPSFRNNPNLALNPFRQNTLLLLSLFYLYVFIWLSPLMVSLSLPALFLASSFGLCCWTFLSPLPLLSPISLKSL